MEKFGGDVIEKFLTAIKGTGGNILDKFKWKNNSVGAELFNVGVAETFWDNIENSFSSLPGFTLLQPLELAQYEIAGFKINNGVIRISIKYGGNTNPNGHTIELKYANNPPFKIRII
ncbi:MAG: hypothetical protein IPM26_13670 [Saprospiraceae bacterium]|nr:hypothetical protein [Saprospiraceae bacterium]